MTSLRLMVAAMIGATTLSGGLAQARSLSRRPRFLSTGPHRAVPLMPEPLAEEPGVSGAEPSLRASASLAGRSASGKPVSRTRVAPPRPLVAARTNRSLYFAATNDPDTSGARRVSEVAQPTPVVVHSEAEHSSTEHLTPWGFGAELGGLFNRSDINSDILGLQALYGGRAFARFPVLNRHFFVTPSLGYYHRVNSEAGVTVTQHVFELGASALYTPWPAHSTILLFGVAQRLDGLISNISVLGTSASTPLGFRYRLGPQVEISTAISHRLNFIADAEVTFTTTVPVHPIGELNIGLMFK